MLSVATATALTVLPLQHQVFASVVEAESGSVLKLARTNVPIDIPLLKGYENGSMRYTLYQLMFQMKR